MLQCAIFLLSTLAPCNCSIHQEEEQVAEENVPCFYPADRLWLHRFWSSSQSSMELRGPDIENAHAAKPKAPSPLPPSASDASAGDHDGGWRASLDRSFALSERGSSLRNEALAGFVCFLANAYQVRIRLY